MTTYKNYNISFKTTNPGMIKGAEPWLYFIHDIANLNYYSAISPDLKEQQII